MSRRAHLHQLTRHLRRYLEWQGAHGVTAVVPASAEERAKLDARKEAHQERQIADLRSQISGDEKRPPASKPGPAPAARPEEKKTERAGGKSPSTSPGEVTSSTPLWKKHDPIHEMTRKQRQRAAASKGPQKEHAAEATVNENPETPAEKMAFLRQYLGDCQRCPLSEGRTNLVFGQGDPRARLMFIGEGPGREEDRQGLAFVGPSGQLLTKMIKAMGLEREEVYITNVVKCRPPGNRNPAPLEIKECSPFLRKQVEVVEPEAIVTLGKFAANTLLEKDDEALGRLRGRWHEALGVPVMPTYHPAYLLRNKQDRRFKERVWSDLQMVMARLGLERES